MNDQLVMHKDLSIQQEADIKKRLEVSMKYPTFWEQFVDETPLKCNPNSDSIVYKKLILPKLTKADIKNLNEGETPAPDKLVYAEFKFGVEDFGTYIPYTDASVRYNFTDVVDDAKTVLAAHAESSKDLRYGNQFLKTKCTITECTDFLDTLSKAKIILTKNNGKPVSGTRFYCIFSIEQGMETVKKYKDDIVHTSEKEAIINGELGELGGFKLISTASSIIYEPGNKRSYMLFIAREGKTNRLPVGKTCIGDDSVQVFNDGLGSVPQGNSDGTVSSDALHQRGTVGYKVQGFGTRMIADECCLLGTHAISYVDENVDFDEASKSGFVRTSESPRNSSYLTLSVVGSDTLSIIDSPTITLKTGDIIGSGTVVKAESDATYKVAAGKYNYSITANGYTTLTGKLSITVVDTAKHSIVKVLVATKA